MYNFLKFQSHSTMCGDIKIYLIYDIYGEALEGCYLLKNNKVTISVTSFESQILTFINFVHLFSFLVIKEDGKSGSYLLCL